MQKTFRVDMVEILNTTRHSIRFQSQTGELIEVPSSGWLISAQPQEVEAGSCGPARLVKTVFVADPATQTKLETYREANPEVVVAGSMIAAQAYPGLVYAVTPAPGFERVSVEEKRMNPLKWTTF